MTAKEYLLQAQRLRKSMESLQDQIDELRTQAEGVKAIEYDRDRVQTSPRDVLSEAVTEIVELEEQYGRRIVEYHKKYLLIESQINELPNPDHVELLRLRDLEPDKRTGRLQSWQAIAAKTHRSFSRTTHLHGEALAAFRKVHMTKDSKQ